MSKRNFEATHDQLNVTNKFSITHIDLIIGHYGFEKTKPDKPFVSSKDYPTYRLHFILDGSVTLFINDKSYLLKKNHCFILLPNSEIGYSTNPNNPATIYWVSFAGKNVNYYLNLMDLNKNKPFSYITYSQQNKIHSAFSSCFAETDKDILDTIFTKNFMSIVHCLFLSSHKSKSSIPSNLYITKCLEIINIQYAEPSLNIKSVAKAINIHPNYLSNLFSSSMGISFNSYITRLRIEASIIFLQQSNLSINQIAYSIGFSDPLYFSKVFKKYNKISPKEYRDTYNQNNKLK